jgi:hypothetical protein
MRPDTVVFEYDDFPPVPKAEWEGSDLRHAFALAGALAAVLREDPRFTCEDPVQEDFGAVLPVITSEGETWITISFYPRNDSDFTWALQFSHHRFFLKAIFARGDDERVVGPVKDRVASLVEAEPDRYRGAQWLDASDL